MVNRIIAWIVDWIYVQSHKGTSTDCAAGFVEWAYDWWIFTWLTNGQDNLMDYELQVCGRAVFHFQSDSRDTDVWFYWPSLPYTWRRKWNRAIDKVIALLVRLEYHLFFIDRGRYWEARDYTCSWLANVYRRGIDMLAAVKFRHVNDPSDCEPLPF